MEKSRLVLDGGLATELVGLGYESIDDDPLWSARILATEPKAIKQVHMSFLEHGADVVITSTYQASLQGFHDNLNVTISEAEGIIANSVAIAKETCETFWEKEKNNNSRTKPLIAGSVGPYGAVLHDASEYTGSYVDNMSVQELIDWHRPRMRILTENGVDILALETIPAKKEAEALVALLREFPGTKAWLTYSCKDPQKTSHGENFCDAVQVAMTTDQVVGVGINCTAPEYIESLLKSIYGKTNGKNIVIYPNSGEIWTEENRWTGKTDCTSLAEYVPTWVDVGADWIGGCCRTTPEDISNIRKALKQ